MEFWKWAVEIGVMVVFYVLVRVSAYFDDKERIIPAAVLVGIAGGVFTAYISLVRDGQL